MGVLSLGAIARGGITGLFYVIRLKHGIIVIAIKWEIRQLHEGLLSPSLWVRSPFRGCVGLIMRIRAEVLV